VRCPFCNAIPGKGKGAIAAEGCNRPWALRSAPGRRPELLHRHRSLTKSQETPGIFVVIAAKRKFCITVSELVS
jgi:hypothetical protein